jgi:mRNA interferase HicA
MSVQQVRDKGPHTICRVGSTQFSLPRHTEINELTARAVCKHLEGDLGKGCWL